jgi:4-hydroxythreonine-4-phosphate dehydrogenase
VSRLPLAVAVGDSAGIGPSVAALAMEHVADETFLVFGDAARLAPRCAAFADRCALVDVGAIDDAHVHAHAPSAAVGAHQLRALDAAADAVRTGRARALVTGPTSKEAIVLAGHDFIGQTEHLARTSGLADDEVTMLFLGPKLRVGLVTTHLAIADVPRAITGARVARTARHIVEAVRLLGFPSPRVAVCGLNPHAGEHGLFGHEEMDVIGPALAALALHAHVESPRPAEAIFREAARGELDAVVAMFHDQATIASKILDWGNAVNVTWGLPFVRTSVDHGVAYDAAARGLGDPDGMIAAVEMARKLT